MVSAAPSQMFSNLPSRRTLKRDRSHHFRQGISSFSSRQGAIAGELRVPRSAAACRSRKVERRKVERLESVSCEVIGAAAQFRSPRELLTLLAWTEVRASGLCQDPGKNARPTNIRGTYFLFSRGLTTPLVASRKSCATGLIARFFRLMTPNGQVGTGRSTGNTRRGGRFVPNFNTESGRATRNGPFGRRVNNKLGDPVAVPRNEIFRARKTSRMWDPAKVSSEGRPQGSFASSARSILRRLLQRLCNPATTNMRSSYKT